MWWFMKLNDCKTSEHYFAQRAHIVIFDGNFRTYQIENCVFTLDGMPAEELAVKRVDRAATLTYLSEGEDNGVFSQIINYVKGYI